MKCRCGREFEREVVAEVKGRIYKIFSCSCRKDLVYEIPYDNKDLWKKVLGYKEN